MREIIFRGKKKPWDGWCEGFLVKTGDHFRISTKNDMISFGVYSETVGQFTGLTDKNGVKIFEGDIVRCNRFACDGEDMVGYIVYNDYCFSVKEHKTPNRPAMGLCDDFEVIGNIHDNPELLEVEHG